MTGQETRAMACEMFRDGLTVKQTALLLGVGRKAVENALSSADLSLADKGSASYARWAERLTGGPRPFAVVWREVCDEAPAVLVGGKKFLVLSEEQLTRVGGAAGL